MMSLHHILSWLLDALSMRQDPLVIEGQQQRNMYSKHLVALVTKGEPRLIRHIQMHTTC